MDNHWTISNDLISLLIADSKIQLNSTKLCFRLSRKLIITFAKDVSFSSTHMKPTKLKFLKSPISKGVAKVKSYTSRQPQTE